MKELAKELELSMQKILNASKLHRFELTSQSSNGKKIVGAAFLSEGQRLYTIKLWTLQNQKFHLLQSNKDNSKYLIMTREPNKDPSSKNKFFWQIVGQGYVDTTQGHIELSFDLFEKKIFMNLFPSKNQ